MCLTKALQFSPHLRPLDRSRTREGRMAQYWGGKSWLAIHAPLPALRRTSRTSRFPSAPPAEARVMPVRRDRPLRAAMARATMLGEFGRRAEAVAEVMRARRDTPIDGRDLSSDEAAALAEGWEFQAADDLDQG